ncbi:uncharacterized protein BDZ99DRAFT_569997 [Mytilinidion resinicola]|uniref:Uncharacterized protein n=1 Tax=Mytilinidion resinicola TaxID=574789 RepID=A0A6A6YQ50_9PEZI|nr:uncharacterized protein BDZ99DRAFT_569997 [Mytilinidion resinicola]KAF2810653.1 hypothetical protein BDZ99DRAFT_569997 [Mytilinidion resinicola]
MHTRQKQLEAQAQYGNAMKALRLYLQGPTKQATSDTLCAVWLLIICQDWIGRHQSKHGDHYEGLSHILNAVASKQDWSDPFDIAMILISSMIVIIDSITNPKVRLGPWFQRFAEAYGPARSSTSDDASMFQTLKLHSLAKIAEYIRNPGPNRFGIEVAYRDIRIDILRIKQCLAEIESPDSPKEVPQNLPTLDYLKLLFRHQVAYGIMIQLTTLLNYILRAFNPPNAQLYELHEASLFFADELVSLARKAAPFRPLGASFITQALCAAWAATEDSARQADIEVVLKDYETDLPNASYVPVAKWARMELEKLRAKVSPSRGLDLQVSADTEELSEEVRRVGARVLPPLKSESVIPLVAVPTAPSLLIPAITTPAEKEPLSVPTSPSSILVPDSNAATLPSPSQANASAPKPTEEAGTVSTPIPSSERLPRTLITASKPASPQSPPSSADLGQTITTTTPSSQISAQGFISLPASAISGPGAMVSGPTALITSLSSREPETFSLLGVNTSAAATPVMMFAGAAPRIRDGGNSAWMTCGLGIVWAALGLRV